MIDSVRHQRKAMGQATPYSAAWYYHLRMAAQATREWRETNTLKAV